jgi:two-component sensor histidine kinase
MPDILAALVSDPLAAEADHRIANNLAILSSLIRLHAAEAARRKQPFSPAEMSAVLEELSLKVDTVAKMHKALAVASNRNVVDLGNFLRSICTGFGTLYGSQRMSLHVDCACGESVGSGEALHIGLAVNEMMTNAIKYAHPTGIAVTITVRCVEAEGGICVEVSDDGVGLPDGFDPVRDGGTGFRLMRSIANQIAAELDFKSDSLGTCCKLVVPSIRSKTPHLRRRSNDNSESSSLNI